jgi:hypothetical protein
MAEYLNAFKAYLQALSLSLLRSLYDWISDSECIQSLPTSALSLCIALYMAGYLNTFNACLQALSLLCSLYGCISERIQSLPTSALFTSLFIRLDI